MNAETTRNQHSQLENRIAQKYKEQGYEVWIEPDAVPFDLSGYRPDLVVKKSDHEGYIIEIKSQSSKQITIDRYKEIAEIVAQHSGWRFLLITGDDQVPINPSNSNSLLSWEKIIKKRKTVDNLITLEDQESAFLILWIILEVLLRKQAEKVSIPIERFSPVSLINHLYSQGELSIEQYNIVINLYNIRNQLVHGFQTVEFNQEILSQLQQLVDQFIGLWSLR
ncbi:hypothetical protein [Crocosphaera sp. XPORK-15E]|uniref:hypothetical protein n=1 Tax=Crocosphaera sp. XPORK-15E TaxID=3110247 RepID=UPI002B220F72|nr:hypothetical protein [Crocosphaera sp. XPORK-15E]MEA5533735.1 hypothetical protein [Crocosphaera sp. XPORK-15E]